MRRAQGAAVFSGRSWKIRVAGLCLAGLAVPLLAAAAGVSARAAEAIDYKVAVVGIEDSALEESVRRISRLEEKSPRPVLTLRALRRRVEASLPRIAALLRARAHYAAKQDFEVAREAGQPAVVTLRIDPGPIYRLARYEIRPATPGEPRETTRIPLKELGLTLGSPALSEDIAAADGRLLAALGRRAYPLARIADRRVTVNHKTRTLSVAVSLATGPYARFGATRIVGLETVEDPFVRRRIAWTVGAPFNADLLAATRKSLRQTGLFTSVRVRQGDAVDASGELGVDIALAERKHRSIGAGAAFSTTEGPLGKLFWEHRNLFGQGEHLRVRGEAGDIRQGVFGDLRVSAFGRNDQDLVIDARATRENPDGFVSLETAAIGRLERRFGPALTGSAGLGYDRSDVEENNTDRIFTYLSVPLSLRRDTSDDLLDPSRGGRDTLTVTPNIGILGTDTNFTSVRLFDTVYLPLMADKELVFAGWARIGTIFGETTLNIPANKRLYSGGSGSVRGYALNSIGPLDAQNDPIGGRSSTEFGGELRWRIADPFGVVGFVEAGGIYDDPVPDWGADLQWGAGLGLRYLTRIGPLRLDVAVPLNRRNSVDDAFQILLSLGQAF